MSKIEATIKLNLPSGIDASEVISQIQKLLSSMNGRDTQINAVEVDNPISANPIHFTQRMGE